MTPDRGALARLADSVADGEPVDWEHLESSAEPHDRRLIGHLRLVESIASLYRSIPPDLEETAPADDAGKRWGRLLLVGRIGHGTSCEVYRALDTDLHREVALKLLHEDGPAVGSAHARLLDEGRRLARVHHPNVVDVYGAERHAGRVGLWMELVAGESLDRIVDARGPLAAGEAALIGQHVCSALAAVHGAGLLHRDVKAQNVLRESGGRIVLMDFGTGEELQASGGPARLVGTPLYVAPEIFDAQPASVQSDLYSVGVLLFYLVTGEFPVAATTMAQLTAAHQGGGARRLRDVRPDLPAAFVHVVDRALAPDRRGRYRTAGELEAALREALVGGRLAGADEQEPVRWHEQRSFALAGLIGLVLLVLVCTMVLWQRLAPPAAPVHAPITRIAVLPLSDLSAVPSPFLADALTDQLIATLGAVGSLRVTAPDSVTRYKGTAMPPSSIMRELGVDAVVQGTVRAEAAGSDAPARALVSIRLLAAGVDAPLWSQSFEWVAGGTTALKTGISRAIVRAIHAALTPGDAGRLADRRFRNPQAEQAYLQGSLHLASYGADRAQRALESFEHAIRLDYDYAAAHAGASRAFVRLGWSGAIPHAEARRQGAAAARTAVRLDPNLAEAHAALADILFFYDWDFLAAEREYETSLELNPSFAYARLYYAEYLAARHRFDEALAQLTLAGALDPHSGALKRTEAMILYYRRDFAGAAEKVREASLLDPDAAGGYLWQARLAEAQGGYREAVGFTNQAVQLSNGGGVPLQIQLLGQMALAGDRQRALDGFKDLEAAAATGAFRVSARDRAYLRLALGDNEGACTLFDQAREEGDPSLVWLPVDPRVDRLRASPRFQAILSAMGLN